MEDKKRMNLSLREETYNGLRGIADMCGFRSVSKMVITLLEPILKAESDPDSINDLPPDIAEGIKDFINKFKEEAISRNKKRKRPRKQRQPKLSSLQ